MPDLGPVFGALLELFGPVIGAALKALMKTVFGMVLLGALVTSVTVYEAAQGSWLRALIAAVLSLVALAIITGMMAVKNAVMRGLLHGLKTLNLGTRLFTMLFDKLGVTEESKKGDRAGALGRAVERIPLQQAEERLSNAVLSVLAERAGKTGFRAWLAGKLISSAVERIQSITLARFRSENAKAGGVDLIVVRDELIVTIDKTLAGMISAQLNKLNFVFATLYVVFAVAIAVLLPRIPLG
jgi:hypothetical protein